MKTPTLIVRIIGIYMIVKSVLGFIGWWEMKRMLRLMGSMETAIGGIQQPTASNVLLLLLVLLVGILVAWHAGILARVLTFDAEKDPARDVD